MFSTMDEDVHKSAVHRDSESSEIARFFNDCNVLITGATGFVGKLLVEKLLRSCPNARLHLLIRSKSGETATARLKTLLQSPFFEKLHFEQPNFTKRISIIQGDISSPDLSLSPEDCGFLQQNTHVIIHAAALTNANASVRKLVETNVRGTKLMILLAKRMPNLKAFVHLSTLFSHCSRSKRVKEMFYRPSVGVEKILSLIELLSDDKLDYLTPLLIQEKAKPYGDAYLFSKALAEEAIRLHAASASLPICIVRSSTVVASTRIDGLRGITGLVVGVHTGLLHVCKADADDSVDLMPADCLVNFLMAVAWDTHAVWMDNARRSRRDSRPVIYHLVSSARNRTRWNDFFKSIKKCSDLYPPSAAFAYRFVILAKNRYLCDALQFLFEFLPVLLADSYAKLRGRKPILRETYEKLRRSVESASYCFARSLKFENKNSLRICDKLNATDRETFNCNVAELDWEEYVKNLLQCINSYLHENNH